MTNEMSVTIFAVVLILGFRRVYNLGKNVYEIFKLHLGIKNYKKEREALK